MRRPDRQGYFRSTLRRLGPSILLLLHPYDRLSAEEPARVLASYRSTVTANELDGWLRFSGEDDSADRPLALRDLIVVRSLAEAALGLGLDRRPEVSLELEIEDGRLATAALRRHLNESVVVTDEQAEAKYQEIKDTYTQPRRVRLRNLFKRYPPEATEADKQAVLAEMKNLRQRLLAGENFGELAEKESDSQSRFRKGLLGNVPAGTFPPPIDDIAMAMQPGQISDILHGADGLTLLYCERILEKVVREPEELREIARDWLARQAFKSAWAELEATLRAEVDARYLWQALDADPPDPGAILVELAGDRLSLADVQRLVRVRSAALEPSRMPRAELREEIEEHLLGRANLREIERRGLEQQDTLAMRRLWARRQVLATHAMQHFVGTELEPPAEEEIRRYYDDHREDFVRPAIFDLAVIRLPLDGDTDRETYRQGERLLHRIQGGEISFEDAARRHSSDPSAADGGRIGSVGRWVLPHRFGFNFLRAALRLEPGEISDVVAEGEDLWILKLVGLEASRPMTYGEARTAAENKVGTARARALQARILDDWIARLQIEPTP